jgi:hypothetical protein
MQLNLKSACRTHPALPCRAAPPRPGRRRAAPPARAALLPGAPPQPPDTEDPAKPGPPAKRVVITGGTRGFGLALARELLSAGDAVVLCGRDAGRVAAVLRALRSEFPVRRARLAAAAPARPVTAGLRSVHPRSLEAHTAALHSKA